MTVRMAPRTRPRRTAEDTISSLDDFDMSGTRLFRR
jgi:hypothetical protein